MEQTGRERDLVLAPNQEAFIQDETKGLISVYVGPNKTSLAATDRPVVYDPSKRKFDRVSLEQAIKEFPFADEGWYIVLENPAASKEQEHPTPATSNAMVKLSFGRKVNIPGPAVFPLWPGQVAKVIEGHHLKSNQFLLVRVYNEDAAKENWEKSVVKPAKQEPSKADETAGADVPPTSPGSSIRTSEITMGKLFVIKGTDVSFYIPPTGVEVVQDSNGKYVRDAVTLERLEYCILLDEDGTKRFEKGPAVVFPHPTEIFVEQSGQRKFKAIELNDDMGIYVKVIEDYEEDGRGYKTGEELFVTGRDQRIYYPRQEHAIIRYGDEGHEKHYGIAIPEGEARYVLDKETGRVDLVKGPRIFLPDPRKEVIVRRVLDKKQVELFFPGNQEALVYNDSLRSIAEKPGEYVTDRAYRKLSLEKAGAAALAAEGFAGDDFRRGTTYTPPRTITLNTKYDGAVTISIWTGYAIMIVDKTGGRRVVVGPAAVMLDYDETLEVLQLSTGKPKTTDKLEKTVFLRVLHNQVSDAVHVVTGDMVGAVVKLSYRVNFEGEPEKWFSVENYVKFLCDHTRSILRNTAKRHGIEEFNNEYINIIRDAVLGVAGESKKRPGRVFEENGMRIYDVEVLGLEIGDEAIARLLSEAQHDSVKKTIDVARKQKELEVTVRIQDVEQQIAEALAATAVKKLAIEEERIAKQLSVTLAKVNAEVVELTKRLGAKRAEQATLGEIKQAELDREKLDAEQNLAFEKERLNQRLEELKAEVQAVVSKAEAISPQLVAALQAFSDRYVAAEAAKAVSPVTMLKLLGGNSLAEVFNNLFKGTVIEGALAASGDGHRPELSERSGSARR